MNNLFIPIIHSWIYISPWIYIFHPRPLLPLIQNHLQLIILLKSRNMYSLNNSIYNFQWAEIFSTKQPTRWIHSSIVQNVFSCSDSRRRFVSSFRKSNDNQRSRLSPDYIWDWLVELFVHEIFARMSNHWRFAHPCYINPFLSTDSLFLLFFVSFSPFEKIAQFTRYK